jgi:hypothetical protein
LWFWALAFSSASQWSALPNGINDVPLSSPFSMFATVWRDILARWKYWG